MADVPPGFDEWCIVELMGHRRIAARVTEVEIFGVKWVRLDTPATPKTAARTSLHQPTAIYGLHPTTEEIVKGLAAQWASTEPVSRYELTRALTAAASDPTPDRDLDGYDRDEQPDPDELADMVAYTEDPAMRDDQEMPGTWETSDFTGGEEVIRGPAPTPT